ncbi:MAG: hypothetical protein HRT57_15800, partial [Crocinitomicaceae bacterium]|nr:hypothetical protein [Crocinitomicaceae bacterium]
DTDEFIEDETEFSQISGSYLSGKVHEDIIGGWNKPITIAVRNLKVTKNNWIRVDTKIKVVEGIGSSHLKCKVTSNKESKTTKIRLHNAISQAGISNYYSFYMKLPIGNDLKIELSIASKYLFKGNVESWSITHYSPN